MRQLHAITMPFFALALLLFAGAAQAAPLPASDYAAAMTRLDAIEARMAAARAPLSQTQAQTLGIALADDLAWLRATKIAAARVDVTSTPTRNLTPERLRARCLVMRTGLIDPALQDLAVNMQLKSRGADESALIPLSASPDIPATPLACRP